MYVLYFILDLVVLVPVFVFLPVVMEDICTIATAKSHYEIKCEHYINSFCQKCIRRYTGVLSGLFSSDGVLLAFLQNCQHPLTCCGIYFPVNLMDFEICFVLYHMLAAATWPATGDIYIISVQQSKPNNMNVFRSK